jgi:hypothetical protein
MSTEHWVPVINYKEAAALGLSVEYLDPANEIWQRTWLLYCMYDYDCRHNRYLRVFEGPNISTGIAAPPPPPPKPRP